MRFSDVASGGKEHNLYKRILLATDFSEASENAMAHAVEMAGCDGAELHVLYVHVLHMYSASAGFHEGYAAETDEESRRSLEALKVPGTQKTVRHLMRGISAAPAIMEYASANDIDLIVLGSHGRTGLTHLFLGSVAQEVVRAAAVPVLVVGHGPAHAVSRKAPCILAAVDFSGRSKAALEAAVAIAEQRKGRLVVMHAIDLTRLPPYFTMEIEAAQRREVERSMDRLLAQVKAPADAGRVICDGPAAWKIVEEARDQGANLIVVGTAGHGLLDRLLVGSVAERVLRQAPCPVLAHRSPPIASSAAAQAA